MRQYLNLLTDCLNGSDRDDRTGTGTRGVFGRQARFNLQDGFPLLTTKKLHFKSIAHELIWIISGDTNIKYLQDNDVRIWNEWADEDGNLGPVYGRQWRGWSSYTPTPHVDVFARTVPGTLDTLFFEHRLYTRRSLDQLRKVITQLKDNPYSRRHIVSAWNPAEIEKMRLPSCHCFFQFYVDHGKLSCQMYQRSADVFLGVPFNIASYALLTIMVAQICELEPYEFIHTFGDLHLYKNHFSQAGEQLKREPRPLPQVVLNPDIKDIDDFKYEDIKLFDYNPHPHIPAKVSV